MSPVSECKTADWPALTVAPITSTPWLPLTTRLFLALMAPTGPATSW